MGADRRYLEWHGNQWRVQVKVPKKARPILGLQRLVVPLHTDSLANANRLKYRAVAQLKDVIARAEVEADRQLKGQGDALVEEAFSWRASLEAEREAPEILDGNGHPIDVVEQVLYDRADEIARSDGAERAGYFVRIAKGDATPLLSLTDAWLAERADMKPRQRIDYKRAVSKLDLFLALSKLDASIEKISRKVAGRYISEAMVAKSIHWKTANKDVSALSSYWRWLLKKGHVRENVWSGQSLPKIRPKSDAQRPKRPFTDAEIKKLIDGISDDLLRDAVTVAALSGLRNEEIARLKVADCVDHVFSIKDAKTAAGVRDVPIHTKLRGLVARRSAGKPSTAYLFHELKDPPPGSAMERGQAITKKFVAARRALGVDERLPDNRQSRVDFHSFRRWFIAKARDALQNGAKGFDQWTISEVVGHDKESSVAGLGMTMGRYAGAQSFAARRACVDSVNLP